MRREDSRYDLWYVSNYMLVARMHVVQAVVITSSNWGESREHTPIASSLTSEVDSSTNAERTYSGMSRPVEQLVGPREQTLTDSHDQPAGDIREAGRPRSCQLHPLSTMAFRALCTLFALGHVSFVFAYSSPPSGAITVGHGGTYSTISAALKDTSSSVYFVYAGSYTEQVYITRANVKIYGQTNYSHTYTGNRACHPIPAGATIID
jgi:pectin methylesterase-like acyl-CoA thioesterase